MKQPSADSLDVGPVDVPLGQSPEVDGARIPPGRLGRHVARRGGWDERGSNVGPLGSPKPDLHRSVGRVSVMVSQVRQVVLWTGMVG